VQLGWTAWTVAVQGSASRKGQASTPRRTLWLPGSARRWQTGSTLRQSFDLQLSHANVRMVC